MILEAAEQVFVDELLDCAACYAHNPMEIKTKPIDKSSLLPDALVWIQYTNESQRISHFKPGHGRKVGTLTGLRAVAEAVGINYYDGYGGFTK